ncbi:hypothetical protein PHSY_005057 [Pseudozyma hubeiensis SY62]|uniref:Uncharacterized protein n=1 Tax=Pseudozyma hubeiensis (strain SY62) TaxID=1305764 RepID=R9P7Y2_PSEHS|nr:hypothetical protein PHSY_005057 [Pseudozyma hubeiensis SY62]GAC97471.1 hypothetical protein PHSY_005057 [Pseudozyma hubeiensis SY62]
MAAFRYKSWPSNRNAPIEHACTIPAKFPAEVNLRIGVNVATSGRQRMNPSGKASMSDASRRRNLRRAWNSQKRDFSCQNPAASKIKVGALRPAFAV